MPKWSRDYLLTALLGGLALVLGLAVALEWTVLARHRGQNLQPPPARTAPVAEPEVEGEDFELPALDDYEQMAERPLFMENRRPGADIAETSAPPPPPPTPMNLKLMGIVSTPRGKTALLVDGKGKYKRLKSQDALDGWVLVELGADKVTMQQGDKREDLPLLKKRPKPPSPPGAPPPPGQPPRPGQRPPPPPPPVPVEAGEDIPEESSDSDLPEEDIDSGTVDEDQ